MKSERRSLRVKPSPALQVPDDCDLPAVSIVGEQPLVVLGNKRVPDLLAQPIVPSAASLFGPRGAALRGGHGPLWICDTGHHRLLGWNAPPDTDESPADLIVGQPDFDSEGRNSSGDAGPATLNVPTGICFTGTGLAVADAWNHRVLIWHELPATSNQPADVVLGQSDFEQCAANHGEDTACDDTLHWPYGVCFDSESGRLIVCDTGNRRVLVWSSMPVDNGQKADFVLGQSDFAQRDENAGAAPCALSMRWPHSAVIWKGNLCVADAGNNRVLVWKQWPADSRTAADLILGQADPGAVDHNQALYWPRRNSLNMPYGITADSDWLLVADTANSRILGWHHDQLSTASGASALVGQPHFNAKGDNRWQPAQADSLCWPYGLQAVDGLLVISDSGNNRVSIWELVP